MNIEMGCIYEIDHVVLPPRTPVQLKSIRVAMVSEKTPLNVAIRFPSTESVGIYLSNSRRELFPAFDEKFVMGTALAGAVLLRQVPSNEFSQKKHLRSFWLVNGYGECLSDRFKVNGMVRKLEKAEEENDDEHEEADEDCKINLKRKRYSFRAKKTRAGTKHHWPEERCKLGEKKLMEVMKAMGATANEPVMRAELREEARKRIGDTGLLDHLLKDIAGKVAPGGSERFRRRYNAEGIMQYWLESAELDYIRKEAGVGDPYWIPPPGWEPGDPPIQHPIYALQFKNLKDDIFILKKDLREMVLSKNQLEEQVECLQRKIDELESQKKQHEGEIAIEKEQLMKATSHFIAKMEGNFLNLMSKLEEKEKEVTTLMSLTDELKEKQVKVADTSLKTEEKAAKRQPCPRELQVG